MSGLASIRADLHRAVFTRVAGARGPAVRDRVHLTPGPRWFPPGAPIRRVHADTSMYVGGLRALLLQSLHPLPMAAVVDHSGYRGDPWGRLANTSTFIATTTFGTIAHAEQSVEAVRAVHARISGTAPDGRAYRADDPHLLAWVHAAEIDSFLLAHQRYGQHRLTPAEADEYVRQAGTIAVRLGATDVPGSTAELAETIEAFRPELAGTDAARSTARFLLLHPPMSVAARLPYALLAMAAVAMLPPWARAMLGLRSVPALGPALEATAVRLAGEAATRALRWVLTAETVTTADEETAGETTAGEAPAGPPPRNGSR